MEPIGQLLERTHTVFLVLQVLLMKKSDHICNNKYLLGDIDYYWALDEFDRIRAEMKHCKEKINKIRHES